MTHKSVSRLSLRLAPHSTYSDKSDARFIHYMAAIYQQARHPRHTPHETGDSHGFLVDRGTQIRALRGRQHYPICRQQPVHVVFYEHPEDYKAHLTHEGELNADKRVWQTANNTYVFSTGLGFVEILIGLLVLSNPISRRAGLLGGALAFGTPLVTLTFLLTTPEAWVPDLGDAEHGFPFLSGAGRLVLKDVLMLAGALPVMADSARQLLQERRS